MTDFRVRKFQYDEPEGFSRMVWVRWGRTQEEADRIVREDTGADPEWTVQVDEYRGPYWQHRTGLDEFDLKKFSSVV